MSESSGELIHYQHKYTFQKKDQYFWKTRSNGTNSVIRSYTRLEQAKLKRQCEENPVAESGPLSKRRSMGRKKLERTRTCAFFVK